jgi:hypothetical protein
MQERKTLAARNRNPADQAHELAVASRRNPFLRFFTVFLPKKRVCSHKKCRGQNPDQLRRVI